MSLRLPGHCCCFCEQGSGIIVHTAPHPLGPWTVQPGEDLACRASTKGGIKSAPTSLQGIPTPGQGCLYGGSTNVSIVKYVPMVAKWCTHLSCYIIFLGRSQQNFVIQVPDANGDMQYIWTGDLWQQAPDGIKGHEGQYWCVFVHAPVYSASQGPGGLILGEFGRRRRLRGEDRERARLRASRCIVTLIV